MRKKIAILIGYLPNPRMYKRIAFYKTLGEVTLICWDRGHNMHIMPEEDGYKVVCVRLTAPGDPLRRIPQYASFSKQAMQALREAAPDVVHTQGLDMLRLACRYKRERGGTVDVVFEVPDMHSLQEKEQNGIVRKAAGRCVRYLDKSLCRQISLLIVTSEQFASGYYNAFVPAEKTFFFPNVPDPEALRNYRKKAPGTPFTVGFIGILLYKRPMKDLVYAAEESGVDLLIAGLENEPPEVEPLCRAYERGDWVGRFNFAKQAAELYSRCDVIHCVYDTDVPNVRVLLPNKLYEAVLCELPILVAKGTYLAKVVDDWGVGLAVDDKDRSTLVEAIEQLRDDRELYESLAENCRKHRADADLGRFNTALRERVLAFPSMAGAEEGRADT